MIHGHKKSDKKKSEEQVKEENELSEKISVKLGEFFSIRKQPIVQNKIGTLLQFTSILMQLCPDITTIFNYRRELIEKILQAQQPAARANTLALDIKLITKIIQGDPKSYTLWSYRQWLVLKLFQIDQAIVNKEKQLCTLLLTKDQKNFHVWNYRNWVNTIKMNVDAQLQFTKSKINSNPFNFSPYHFRSKYLTEKYAAQLNKIQGQKKQEIIDFGMPKDIFNSELETVKTAIFLNPKEQAPWLYYNWLLQQLLPAFLLDIRSLQQGNSQKFQILFSQKLDGLEHAIKCEGGKELQLVSDSRPSDKWKIIFKEPIDKKDISINPNFCYASVKKQSPCRKIIVSKTENINYIKQIYQAQQIFIKQVLQSEENQCRFAWLQLLQIYKFKLYLGVNPELWTQIIAKALPIFENLQGESKGQKYIQKKKQQWLKLQGSNKNWSQIEVRLSQFRKS